MKITEVDDKVLLRFKRVLTHANYENLEDAEK